MYPHFYLITRASSDPSLQVYLLGGALEVCGIGAAISVHGSSRARQGFSLISRSVVFLLCLFMFIYTYLPTLGDFENPINDLNMVLTPVTICMERAI